MSAHQLPEPLGSAVIGPACACPPLVQPISPPSAARARRMSAGRATQPPLCRGAIATSADKCSRLRGPCRLRTGHQKRTRQLRKGQRYKRTRHRKISSFPPNRREKSDRHTSAFQNQFSNPFQKFGAFVSILPRSGSKWRRASAG
jgi:hypothetical protein